MTPKTEKDIAVLAQQARRLILEMTSSAGAAHVGSALSVVDIVAAAYSSLDISPANWEDRSRGDSVIFSKGHAASALYSVLALRGFFPRKWLTTYCKDSSQLGGHVTHGVPGVLLSTGSLGHGLPFATGLSMAQAREGRNNKIVVIVSDGEMDEGTTWESALFAAHHKLSNLTLMIDRNRLQSLTSTEETLGLEPLDEKFKAFGWRCTSVDGHDYKSLAGVLSSESHTEEPHVVICNTVKGKGVSFMENQIRWHYRPPNSEELAAALSEIGSV